jgi:hypothetical protein
MSIRDFALLLLAGDEHAALLFVDSLPDPVQLTLGIDLLQLREAAYIRMLRDPDAFMAFEIPDVAAGIELGYFVSVMPLCSTTSSF